MEMKNNTKDQLYSKNVINVLSKLHIFGNNTTVYAIFWFIPFTKNCSKLVNNMKKELATGIYSRELNAQFKTALLLNDSFEESKQYKNLKDRSPENIRKSAAYYYTTQGQNMNRNAGRNSNFTNRANLNIPFKKKMTVYFQSEKNKQEYIDTVQTLLAYRHMTLGKKELLNWTELNEVLNHNFSYCPANKQITTSLGMLADYFFEMTQKMTYDFEEKNAKLSREALIAEKDDNLSSNNRFADKKKALSFEKKAFEVMMKDIEEFSEEHYRLLKENYSHNFFCALHYYDILKYGSYYYDKKTNLKVLVSPDLTLAENIFSEYLRIPLLAI